MHRGEPVTPARGQSRNRAYIDWERGWNGEGRSAPKLRPQYCQALKQCILDIAQGLTERHSCTVAPGSARDAVA